MSHFFLFCTEQKKRLMELSQGVEHGHRTWDLGLRTGSSNLKGDLDLGTGLGNWTWGLDLVIGPLACTS